MSLLALRDGFIGAGRTDLSTPSLGATLVRFFFLPHALAGGYLAFPPLTPPPLSTPAGVERGAWIRPRAPAASYIKTVAMRCSLGQACACGWGRGWQYLSEPALRARFARHWRIWRFAFHARTRTSSAVPALGLATRSKRVQALACHRAGRHSDRRRQAAASSGVTRRH